MSQPSIAGLSEWFDEYRLPINFKSSRLLRTLIGILRNHYEATSSTHPLACDRVS